MLLPSSYSSLYYLFNFYPTLSKFLTIFSNFFMNPSPTLNSSYTSNIYLSSGTDPDKWYQRTFTSTESLKLC